MERKGREGIRYRKKGRKLRKRQKAEKTKGGYRKSERVKR